MGATDLAALYRQLSMLAGAGISPAESFGLLSRQRSGANQRRLESLMQRLWSGERISRAMAAYPTLFPATHCALVVEGEATGRLDQVLTRLAAVTEHSDALRRMLQREIFPHTLTLIVALPFVIFLLPALAGPVVTAFAWLLVGLFGLLILVSQLTINLPGKGRAWATKIAAKVPTLGAIARSLTLSYFGRSFSLLYGAGVPVSPALGCAAQASGDPSLVEAVGRTVAQLDRGQSMLNALESTGFFPPYALSMASTGEAAGSLETLFDHIAAVYEQEAADLLHLFAIRVGVIGLIIVGVLVFLIVGSFFRRYYGG